MSYRRNYRETNLELAIEMSDVTLQICWDSIIQKYPEVSYEKVREFFLRRIENSVRKTLDKKNN